MNCEKSYPEKAIQKKLDKPHFIIIEIAICNSGSGEAHGFINMKCRLGPEERRKKYE